MKVYVTTRLDFELTYYDVVRLPLGHENSHTQVIWGIIFVEGKPMKKKRAFWDPVFLRMGDQETDKNRTAFAIVVKLIIIIYSPAV